MKRKRLISPTGSNIPLVPVEIKNTNVPQTKAEFFAEEERKRQEEEGRRQEQELRPLREMERQSNIEILQERDRQRRWLSVVPSEYLSEHCVHISGPAMSPDAVTAKIREAFSEFKLNLTRQGVTLNESATPKIRKVVEQNPTVDLRICENWQKIYTLMDELGCFTDTDRTVQVQPIQPVKKQARPTFADVEKINTLAGSDSEREARKLTTNLMTMEIQPRYDMWAQSLIDDFGHYLTEKQTRAACAWFTNNSHHHSPMISKSWDACRRSLVSQFIFPDSCLRPDEREARDLESVNLSAMSFDERRDLRNRLQRLQDQD
jgi:hypothetical protein